MLPNQSTLIDGKVITHSEFRTIQLLVQEKARKQIAAERKVSEDTLDGQMRFLFKKVGVKNAVGLAAWAIENGFNRQGNYSPKNKPAHLRKKIAGPVNKKKK